MDKLSTQKRVLLATLLSFAFFIAYDYFFIPKQIQKDINSSVVSQQVDKNQAPVDNSSNAPSVSLSSNSTDKVLTKIKAKNYEAHIDNLGRISKFYLNEEKYKNEDGSQTQLINSPMPLEIRFSDSALNELAFRSDYTADISEVELNGHSKTINLTQNLGDMVLTKKITFYENGKYDLEIKTSKKVEYFVTTGLRSNIAIDAYTIHGARFIFSDGKSEDIEDGDVKGGEKLSNVVIAAASDRYYTSLFYKFDKPLEVVMSADTNQNSLIFIKQNDDFVANGYIGPKEYVTLKSIDERLVDVIEYGWFTFISKPMFRFLDFLHTYIGNWGWAIVVLTIIIRIVLFPLTYKGMLSMNKLKELAPKMKEIQTKYKGDPQKLNAHMMELYKKNNANPMGGCLPILMQIPIFFAIYRVLLNAIELKGADWILWINDLSIMDPYFILPILMGVTMYLQQKLTPTTFTDPMQEKIMKFLPLIFTFFFVTFPAGLTLYWFVNNVCSVVQQIFVNKLFEKHKNKSAEVKA